MSPRSRRVFSRRQMLAVFTGVAASSALSAVTVVGRPAYAETEAGASVASERSGLPDTDRAKVVRPYRSGGRAVRTAAAAALAGSAAEVATFLGQTLPVARA
ncbi:hypothetical protein AAH978_19770 [Streptomyces sp. ZYX-F-203]